MSAPHFFAPAVKLGDVTLTGDEARHASRVLRIKEGEQITISDGRGRVVRARVTSSERDVLHADATEERFVEPLDPRLTVWPAVAKNDKLDLVVQKLTELGVAEIRPWFAARSIVRWDAPKRAAHGDRWRAIAREAAKQSRRAWLPGVWDPADGVDVDGSTIVLHEGAAIPLRRVLEQRSGASALVVGPEGGFDEDEVAEMTGRGAVAATLGEQILRSETASIVGAAAVLTLKGGLA